MTYPSPQLFPSPSFYPGQTAVVPPTDPEPEPPIVVPGTVRSSALRPYRGLSGGDRTLVIYRGSDGTPRSRFFLSGRGQGKQGVELAPGLIGLDRPPSELVWMQEARQNGADLAGNNIDVRTIKGAVNILGTDPRSTRDAYARWTRAQSLEEYGQLVFINSYSGYRYCSVLLAEATNASIDKEPVLRNGMIGYPFSWVAPNPYFKGHWETFDKFSVTQIDGSWKRGKIQVRNLGDATAHPQIFLPGPNVGQVVWRIPSGQRWSDTKDMVNPNEYMELPPLGPGDHMWLNTDPRMPTIDLVRADGQTYNQWAKMKGRRPRLELPPLRSEPWNLSYSGTIAGTPRVEVQPLYTTYQ